MLSAKAAGIEDLGNFEWLGRSNEDAEAKALHEHEFLRSKTALSRRGTMDSEGDITPRGLELGGIQVSRVELPECLSEADAFACALEMATFLAFISQRQNPFDQTKDGAQSGLMCYARVRAGCYDDLEFYLRLYHHWDKERRSLSDKRLEAWAKSEGLNIDALKDLEKSRKDNLKQFAKRSHKAPDRVLDLKRLHRVRLLLAKCLPEWIYVKQPDGGLSYSPFSTECPCLDPVEIDRDSVCSGLLDRADSRKESSRDRPFLL